MTNPKKQEDEKVVTMNVSVPRWLKEAITGNATSKKMSRSAYVTKQLIRANRKNNNEGEMND